MNKIRVIVAGLFASPMQNMDFPSYFSYINTTGKITARSIMDLSSVLLTFADEQEKKNEQNEANFKQIEEILKKLVEKKMETATHELAKDFVEKVQAAPEPKRIYEAGHICPTCGKECASDFGLQAHQRSHKQK